MKEGLSEIQIDVKMLILTFLLLFLLAERGERDRVVGLDALRLALAGAAIQFGAGLHHVAHDLCNVTEPTLHTQSRAHLTTHG